MLGKRKGFLMGIEQATHALTVLFGLTSWANVRAFLGGAGHDVLAAMVLSAALGAALIVVSIALTKIDWQTERQAFGSLVAVGLALGVISGALQSAEYAVHLHGLWPYLLGYGIPLIGEVGLSLASALFTKAQRRSDLRGINAKIEGAILSNLDEAIAGFDPSTIQRRIERSLNVVAVRAVDGVTANLMSLYDGAKADVVEDESGTQVVNSVVAAPDVTEPRSHNVPTPEDLAAARSAKKKARMQEVWTLINAGQLSLNQIAAQMSVTEKTIDRYIAELRRDGHAISVNGVVKLG